VGSSIATHLPSHFLLLAPQLAITHWPCSHASVSSVTSGQSAAMHELGLQP
jgi:hypothetical protein